MNHNKDDEVEHYRQVQLACHWCWVELRRLSPLLGPEAAESEARDDSQGSSDKNRDKVRQQLKRVVIDPAIFSWPVQGQILEPG